MEQKIDDDELYKSTYRKEIKSIPLPPFYVSKEALSQPKLPKELLLQERRQKSYDWVNTEILLRERLIRTMQTVTGIDRMIGELRLTLKKLNIHQNTILILLQIMAYNMENLVSEERLYVMIPASGFH